MNAAADATLRLIPYSFAKAHGALLLEVTGDEARVCLREGTAPRTLAELRRVLGLPVRVAAIEPAESFERRLADAYAQASQSAWAGTLPFTTSKNRLWMRVVTGPRFPSPIWRLSSSRMGVTSAAVPVKKASSAM